jgi:hypothetical protein
MYLMNLIASSSDSKCKTNVCPRVSAFYAIVTTDILAQDSVVYLDGWYSKASTPIRCTRWISEINMEE